MTRLGHKARHGTALYVAVVGVGMLVSVIALTSSLTGRMELRSNQTHARELLAATSAQSGVEYALNWMNRHSDWRTLLTSGVDFDQASTYTGSFFFRVTDADGDLADDPRDHAVLRVLGMRADETGNSYCVLKVDIEPAGRALTCLESAVHSHLDLTVEANATLTGNGIASSNLNIEGVGGDGEIDLDAEAVGACNGGTYNAGQIDGASAREMPSEHVFDWYVQRGTQIEYTDLANFFGNRYLQLNRFTRWVNPHGEPSPWGIYWIDCGGESPRMKWSRLLGTLVLLNAGPETRIEDVTVFQAEAQNYPVLLVQGDLKIDLRAALSGQELREGFGTNYNPPGVPYEGVVDTDTSDSYPARLDGIVYASGTIRITDDAIIHGNLVANEVVVEEDETLDVEHRPYAYNYPPPGFSAGQGVRVLPGTYRRVDRASD